MSASGRVVDIARMSRDHTVVSENKKLLELPVAPPFHLHRDDPTQAEWVVPVRWHKTVPLREARRFPGMFANQNVVCRLRHAATNAAISRGRVRCGRILSTAGNYARAPLTSASMPRNTSPRCSRCRGTESLHVVVMLRSKWMSRRDVFSSTAGTVVSRWIRTFESHWTS